MDMIKLIFCINKFFGSGYFLIHEIFKKWPKSDRSQKSQNDKKVCFFMAVNHAKKFLNSGHAVALFSWLFLEILTS